jgi:hypothetical protein
MSDRHEHHGPPPPAPDRPFFWLAVNGPRVAATLTPLRPGSFKVSPTPEQLIGFPTRQEQARCQKFLLGAPIAEVDRYMNGELRRRVDAGEVAYVLPQDPEPPTRGPTAWLLVGPQ